MDAQQRSPAESQAPRSELALFIAALCVLEIAFFWDALRPGWVLSAADWVLATASFHESGEREYEPSNRLLTDIACQMEPWMDLVAREWQSGRVALWNPYAGCGVPLLANAQSGVFNPVNFIYFLTRSPHAWVAMAMVKLFVAGLGAYLLACNLRLGPLGRWFVGLSFPFTGFVVVWLQYPMGSVAVWLPLVIWLVQRLGQSPGAMWAGWLAMVLGIMHLSGHPETTAHILLIASAVVLWRCFTGGLTTVRVWRYLGWCMVSLGVSLLAAAVQLVPLAEYLQQSEAWAERSAELQSALQFRKPHVLAMPALVAPYVYGSYLRGHPHVEKALGVENFNEIAGGYAGLVTLGVLVPLAIREWRRYEWIPFWLTVDGVCMAVVFRLPLLDNVARLIPVLNVTQNQRLLLVVSLAHCLLGGAALDSWSALAESGARHFRWGLAGALTTAAAACGIAAVAVRFAGPAIERRAAGHFEKQAQLRGLPDEALQHRAREMAARAIRFFPRYYGGLAIYATILVIGVVRSGAHAPGSRWPVVILGVCLVDLFMFGRNYNPAIPLEHYFPESAVTRFLSEPPQDDTKPFRVLSLEEEFPPNVLGRYQIADLRNYDAIELRRSLDLFEPLWPAQHGHRTSNAWTTWEQVRACADILQLANVRYIISTTEPPLGFTAESERFNRVMIQRLDGAGSALNSYGANAFAIGSRDWGTYSIELYRAGYVEAQVEIPEGHKFLVFSETFMPGWRASVDGESREITPYRGAFMSIAISPGEHRVHFEYSPASFRVGRLLSALGVLAIALLFAPSGVRRFIAAFHSGNQT
jgi:hypothetical protein